MKTKFLLLLLLTILLQVNTSSFAREMKSARQIELRTKTPAQHRSIPITPVAFIEDALVTIDLGNYIQSYSLKPLKSYKFSN